jgi:hypothetical protein
MIRRAVLLLLLIVVPVGTIVLAGLGFVSRNDWAKRRLQEAAAVQLAQTLDAEVRVGNISGDLVRGFTVRDVAVSEGRSFAEGTLASAKSIHLKANVWEVLRKRTPPIAALVEVRVVGLRGKLARGPDGKLNIDRLIRRVKPPTAALKARFRGRIIIEGAELEYADHALAPPALRGLALRLVNVDASADFARRDMVDVALRADGAAAPFARVEASGSYVLSSRAAWVNATVTGARLPDLYNRFVHNPAARIHSGVVNATGNACLLPGQPPDFAVIGHAAGVSADVAALHGERVQGQADFVATPAGLELRNVRAEALGATISADGCAFDLKAPTLDLTASATDVDLDRWAALAPRVVESLPKITGARGVRLQGRITGPLTDPDVTVAAQFPSRVGVEYAAPVEEPAEGQEPREPPVARAEASGVTVTASIPDVSTQDALVQVSAAELDTSDLGVFLPEQEYLSKLQPAPLHNVKAQIAYSRRTAAAGGHVVIEEIDTDHGPVRGVQVRYALLGRALRAEVSAKQILGGQASANGLLDFAGERPYVYADVDTDGVDLEALADVLGLKDYNIQGRADASGVLTLHDQELGGAVEVASRGASVDTVELDTLHAHLGLTDEAVDVRYATATSPLGAVWARGTVPLKGPTELEVTAANVPLAQARAAAEQFGRKEPAEEPEETPKKEPVEIGGRAFAHGWVRGELRTPQVTADVAVFGGSVGGVTTEAVTASVQGTPQEVNIANLLARRGTATLSGAVTISDIVWPPGTLFAQEPAADDDEVPPPAPPVIDGQLEGVAQVRGADLGQLKEFLDLPPDLRIGGVAQVDAQISGTLQNPTAVGRLWASHLKAMQETNGVAAGPVEFAGTFAADQDSVRVVNGSASSAAGSLTVSGEVGGWHAEEGPFVVAQFGASGLPISAYTPADGPAALVEGTVDSLTGTVAGPLEQPWPTVKAKLAAHEVRFGRRQARNIETDLGYREGVLSANNLKCDLAGGALAVRAASFRPSDRKMFADLTGTDLDAQQLAFLAGDVASAGREDPGSIALRDRIYAYGHRLRGKLTARQIAIGGTPEGLEGRVKGLSAQDTEFDRKVVPGVSADFHFAGLRIGAPAGEPPKEGTARPLPPALAQVRVDGLRVTSDPIGKGVILVHGEDISKGATIDLGGDVDLVAEADLIPVGAVNDWLPRDLKLGGDLSFAIKAKGSVEDPEVWSSFEVFKPTVAGVQFDLLQAAYVEVQPEAITLTGGLLKRGANEAQVNGSLPFDRKRLRLDSDGPVSLEARIEDLPADVLLELGDEFAAKPAGPESGPSLWKEARATGMTTAWLKVAGKLGEPEVTGGVSMEPGGTFRMASWSEDSTIRDIGGDLLLGKSPTGVGANVEALHVRGRWQDTQLALDGRAEVSHLAANELLDNRIDELTFTAKADKQRFPGGTIAKDLKAVVKAHTDPEGWHVLTVEEGHAKLGSGSATLTGAALLDTLHLSELGSVPCDLRLVFDKAQVKYGRAMDRGQVDGTLVARKFASRTGRRLPESFLAGQAPGDSLDPLAPATIATARKDSPGEPGRLEITRASLGIPKRKEPTEAEGAVPETPQPGQERHLYGLPSYLPSPRLDVTVAVGHSVDFDTAIVHGNVVPDPKAVRLTGSPQAPRLVASASMRDGSLRLLRGNLEVPDAGVKVETSPEPYVGLQPPLQRELALRSELHGHAEGTVSGTTLTGESIGPFHVKLDLSGGLPPDHVLTASAEPPLSSSEVYELLAVAPLRPGEQASPSGSQTMDQILAGAVASRVFSGVLEPIEQELSEALGLEQLQVTVGLNQPVEFRVGKYLIKDLLVSYMRTAGGPTEEFDLRVSYKVSDKMQVSWNTDEQQQNRVAVEYRWQF